MGAGVAEHAAGHPTSRRPAATTRWRRTPVQGYHYYLWWIPLSESQLAGSLSNGAGQTILVYSIRHHDETDDPIDPASIDDFEEIARPRSTCASTRAAPSAATSMARRPRLATVKGLPGSGSTISLFYLVRDLALQSNLQHLLYVTYTSRLKRGADFLAAQAPEMEGRAHIRTLTELERRRSQGCRPMSTRSANWPTSSVIWIGNRHRPWAPGGATRPASTRKCAPTSWAQLPRRLLAA